MGKLEDAAAALIGEPVLAGANIATPGTSRKLDRSDVVTSLLVHGPLGVAAALFKWWLGRGAQPNEAPMVEGYQGWMYVAVGPTNLAFLEYKRGLLRVSVNRLLVAVPRSAVAGFEKGAFKIGDIAYVSKYAVLLTDGTYYALEAGAGKNGELEKVRQTLNLSQIGAA